VIVHVTENEKVAAQQDLEVFLAKLVNVARQTTEHHRTEYGVEPPAYGIVFQVVLTNPVDYLIGWI